MRALWFNPGPQNFYGYSRTIICRIIDHGIRIEALG